MQFSFLSQYAVSFSFFLSLLRYFFLRQGQLSAWITQTPCFVSTTRYSCPLSVNTDMPIFFAGSLLLANERKPSKINAPTSKHKTNQTADLIKFKILFFIHSIPYIYTLNELFDFFYTIQYNSNAPIFVPMLITYIYHSFILLILIEFIANNLNILKV